MNEDLLKRIKGIIIGCSFGDALGMPTEAFTQEKVKKMYPDGVKTFIDSPPNNFIGRVMPAGSVTDDTINTIFVLDSLVENKGKINADDFVKKLLRWMDSSDNWKNVMGPSTAKALVSIQNGTPIEKAGIFGTTNGASMKISPIGIISNYNNLNDLVNNVYQICLPTHNTKIAIQCASAIAAIISYVSEGGKNLDFIWELSMQVLKVSENYGFDMPSSSLGYKISHAKDIIENSSKEHSLKRLYNEIGPGFESVEFLPIVLAIITLSKGDPKEAAIISANYGGDTDTIGAISTAICGGMNPNFDSGDIELLEKVNEYNFEEVSRKILEYSPFFQI